MRNIYETLGDTGERMIPEETSIDVFWQHIYRYKFAANYVKGKRVLDIACGEGYGTYGLLESGASNVIGVDISESACEHARAKYGIETMVGKAESIPLNDRSVDIVVSFETIEHTQSPDQFLKECIRVLKKGGTAIISTPNLDLTRDSSKANLFHCSEMDYETFISLIERYFSNYEVFSQYPIYAKWHGVNSVIADKSPLLKIKGMWRFRNIMQSIFCPNILDVKEKYRDSPCDFIKRGSHFLHSFFNPYIIRHRRLSEPKNSLYFIIVAKS